MPGPRRRKLIDRLRGVRRLLRPLEAAQVRHTGRSVLSILFRTPVLVLATTGRRTGRRREITLAHLRLADGSILLVGGAGGQTRVPDWVANLRADPVVEVTMDRRTTTMRAVELEGDERAAAWEVARGRWPRIARYEAAAGRPVPVIRLSDAGAEARPPAARRAGRRTTAVLPGRGSGSAAADRAVGR